MRGTILVLMLKGQRRDQSGVSKYSNTWINTQKDIHTDTDSHTHRERYRFINRYRII